MKILNIYNSISNTTIPYELERSMRNIYKSDSFRHLCINRIKRLLKNFCKIYYVIKKNDIIHTHHTFSSVIISFYKNEKLFNKLKLNTIKSVQKFDLNLITDNTINIYKKLTF